jgi:hypothetical protein
MSCTFKIESDEDAIIPLNNEIETIYKLFSSVPCDITVKVSPSFIHPGECGCPKGPRGPRGAISFDSGEPLSKAEYKGFLIDSYNTLFEIKSRDQYIHYHIKQLQDLICSMKFDSLKMITEKDTNSVTISFLCSEVLNNLDDLRRIRDLF